MSFYSSSIFAEAGYSTIQCLLASFGFGLVNVSILFFSEKLASKIENADRLLVRLCLPRYLDCKKK